eukprot:1137947-Pelagomonas_calceolata.AAC.5
MVIDAPLAASMLMPILRRRRHTAHSDLPSPVVYQPAVSFNLLPLTSVPKSIIINSRNCDIRSDSSCCIITTIIITIITIITTTTNNNNETSGRAIAAATAKAGSEAPTWSSSCCFLGSCAQRVQSTSACAAERAQYMLRSRGGSSHALASTASKDAHDRTSRESGGKFAQKRERERERERERVNEVLQFARPSDNCTRMEPHTLLKHKEVVFLSALLKIAMPTRNEQRLNAAHHSQIRPTYREGVIKHIQAFDS